MAFHPTRPGKVLASHAAGANFVPMKRKAC